jgi:hypothetical protein
MGDYRKGQANGIITKEPNRQIPDTIDCHPQTSDEPRLTFHERYHDPAPAEHGR